ncbi:MAG: radical SAM protein [Candidatus Omnitrophota bacterium]|nr:radical SAM protein [Candidatus Omnitrophota bacterium]
MRIMLLIPPSKYAKNVARDLIYGCWCKGKRIAGIQFPPISQLQVVTLLRDEGHDVVLYDAAALHKNVKDIKKEIRAFEAVVVLTSTSTINEDAEILSQLKDANPRLKTICYGSHPTFMPFQTVQKNGIDIAVRREPEFIIRDLINALAEGGGRWQETVGISFKRNGAIISNPDYPFIENLDVLPIPDRSLLPRHVEYFNPVVKQVPFTTMFTSRGCFGRCVFCTVPAFYGSCIRFRSAEKVVEEMQLLQSQGYREVFFRDELFTVSRKRVIDICKGIQEKRLSLSWICSSRIDLVDLEMLRMMKEADCHMIRFGVESASQQILGNIKKDITVEQIEKAFAWTNQLKLDTHAHLMIGCPGETRETIKETMRFVKRIKPTIVTFGICTPYPGTVLFESVSNAFADIGDGSSCDLSRIHTEGFYNRVFTKLTNEELGRSVRRAYRSFYLRLSYIAQWVKRFRSFGEIKRIFSAGTQIFIFILCGENTKRPT